MAKKGSSRRPARKLTDEERAAKRAVERKLMGEAIEQLRCSEGWQRWLGVRRHFHRYSLHNQILIAFQMPGATRVAGFRQWLKLGYAVKKGEHGICIWAPCPPSKEKLRKWREAGADPEERPRTFFRLVKVFDRSQVAALPEFPGGPVDLDPPGEPVSGERLAYLFPALRDFGESVGSPIRIEPGRSRGSYSLADGRIRVDPVGEDFSANAQVAVAVHELSHALVRCERREEDPKLTYGEEEVVVECVAYTVCASLGLDTSGSAVPYMTAWSKGGEIERYAGLIDRLASRLEDAVLATARPQSAEEDMALAAA
jgi:antirestriction protein ArdC